MIPETNTQIQIVSYFTNGGIFMWPLLAVSLMSLYITLERYFSFRFRYGVDGKQLFHQVKKYWTSKDQNRAIETCRQYSNVPLAQVLVAGLTSADRDTQEMETAMEAEALHYVPMITDKLSYLVIFANVATLLGLLGTVSGLIESFSAVGLEAGMQKGQMLASGISIAMYCTAFGLIIAVPTVLAHHFLATKANRMIDEIQHYSVELKRLIQDARPSKA